MESGFCIQLISLWNISVKYDIWFWFFKTTSEMKCDVPSPNAITILCVLVVTISKSAFSNTGNCKYVTKQVVKSGNRPYIFQWGWYHPKVEKLIRSGRILDITMVFGPPQGHRRYRIYRIISVMKMSWVQD